MACPSPRHTPHLPHACNCAPLALGSPLGLPCTSAATRLPAVEAEKALQGPGTWAGSPLHPSLSHMAPTGNCTGHTRPWPRDSMPGTGRIQGQEVQSSMHCFLDQNAAITPLWPFSPHLLSLNSWFQAPGEMMTAARAELWQASLRSMEIASMPAGIGWRAGGRHLGSGAAGDITDVFSVSRRVCVLRCSSGQASFFLLPGQLPIEDQGLQTPNHCSASGASCAEAPGVTGLRGLGRCHSVAEAVYLLQGLESRVSTTEKDRGERGPQTPRHSSHTDIPHQGQCPQVVLVFDSGFWGVAKHRHEPPYPPFFLSKSSSQCPGDCTCQTPALHPAGLRPPQGAQRAPRQHPLRLFPLHGTLVGGTMPSGSGPTRQSLGVYTCLFSISSSPFELLKSPHLGGHEADPSTCSSRKTLSEFQPLSVQRARGRGNARGGNKNQGSDLLTWPLCRAQAPSTSGGLGVRCPQRPGPSAGLALHLPRGAWTPLSLPVLGTQPVILGTRSPVKEQPSATWHQPLQP